LGNYTVPDPAMRAKIMRLRFDPTANAVMAGAFTNQNAAQVGAGIGRKPTDGELYIAHFLGPSGAVKLISQAGANPGARAAKLFPEAARANHSIFYDKQGAARSVGQVYAVLTEQDRLRSVPEPMPASLQVAGAAPAATTPAVPLPVPRPAAADAAQSAAPNVVQAAGPADAPVAGNAYAGETAPVFHALFRNERTGPVSPLVGELWGGKLAADSVPLAQAKGVDATPLQPGQIARPLDLRQFLRPELRRSVQS